MWILKETIHIELLEEHEGANIYSIKRDGEKYSEFEKFILKYRDSCKEDMARILYRIRCIAKDGMLERYYRYEGKRKDRVVALPSYFESTRLRVYCLCISCNIVILGEGGIKESRTYNENPELNKFVETLQAIDAELRLKEQIREIRTEGNYLLGDLTLQIGNDE